MANFMAAKIIKLKNSITWYFFRKFPNFFKPKSIKNREDFYLEGRDDEENVKHKLEDDDLALVHSLIAIEIFTSSYSQMLISRLQALSSKWREGRSDVSEFIEKLRISFFGAGSANLGIFVSEHDKSRFWTGEPVVSELPSFADSAHGRVFQVSPSITAVIIEFRLKEQDKTSLFEAYNANYDTKIIPYKKHMHYSSRTPLLRKRDEVLAVRKKWREGIQIWFQKEFAGAFTSSHKLSNIPITEVIELKKSKPFSTEGENSAARALGIDGSVESWSLNQNKKIKFSASDNYLVRESRPWTSIAYNRGTSEEIADTDSNFSSYRIREYFSPVIIALGLQNLLSLYGSILSTERDHLNVGWNKIAPYSRLRRLEKLDLKRADISLTLSDILNIDDSGSLRDIPKMECYDESLKDKCFSELISNHILRQARRLKEFDNTMADMSFRRMIVSSSTESVRLQIIVASFAIISLILAYGNSTFEFLRNKGGEIGQFLSSYFF